VVGVKANVMIVTILSSTARKAYTEHDGLLGWDLRLVERHLHLLEQMGGFTPLLLVRNMVALDA
jgi:hypothetical protein